MTDSDKLRDGGTGGIGLTRRKEQKAFFVRNSTKQHRNSPGNSPGNSIAGFPMHYSRATAPRLRQLDIEQATLNSIMTDNPRRYFPGESSTRSAKEAQHEHSQQ